jgi:hypothetical protein
MRGLKVRGAGRRPVTAGGAREGARLTRLAVGDEPDGRAPPVSVRRKKEKREKGGCWAGEGADWANLGRCARGRKRKASGLEWLRAKNRRKGEREGEEKKRVSFFF